MKRSPKSQSSAKKASSKKPLGRSGKSEKAAKPAKLRIIGGHMRGRTVIYHGELFTRPMKDNIRENVFNILSRACKGAVCYDLFAGTGALGFEAISRGATSSVLVEQNRRAVAYIQQTTESLELGDKVRVITADTFRVASELLGPPAIETPWIVFLCPPYVLWEESLEELSAIIRQVQVNAPPGSVLMVETEKSFDQDRLPAGDWDRRTYGGTTLGFLEPAQVCGMNL